MKALEFYNVFQRRYKRISNSIDDSRAVLFDIENVGLNDVKIIKTYILSLLVREGRD